MQASCCTSWVYIQVHSRHKLLSRPPCAHKQGSDTVSSVNRPDCSRLQPQGALSGRNQLLLGCNQEAALYAVKSVYARLVILITWGPKYWQ